MRKEDHIKLALKNNNEKSSLDDYKIDYNSVPTFGIKDIDTSIKILGEVWECPFFINAITFGGDYCNNINKQLAEVCDECNIKFFPGSYSPALKNEDDKKNYPRYRSVNVGLDKKIEDILQAVENTHAKYLQLHTNPLQEMIMPEGDHNFENWEKTLKGVREKINIPLILKETGFGMNKKTIKLAVNLKLDAVDISGKGGTNFATIENDRKKNKSNYLDEIGYTTSESLEIAKKYREQITVIASGGVSNPLHVVKCLALGAHAVGVSKAFLEILVKDGKEALIEEIKKWQKEIKFLMILMDAKKIEDLYLKIRKN